MEPVVLTPVFYDKVGRVFQPINDAQETDQYVISEDDYQRLRAIEATARGLFAQIDDNDRSGPEAGMDQATINKLEALRAALGREL